MQDGSWCLDNLQKEIKVNRKLQLVGLMEGQWGLKWNSGVRQNLDQLLGWHMGMGMQPFGDTRPPQ